MRHGAEALRTFFKRVRIASRKTLDAYHAAHPRCEVIGCGREAMPTPHHLRHPRGDDVESNIISLCWSMHVGPEGIHTLGLGRWFARFGDRLLPEARAKVEAVARR